MKVKDFQALIDMGLGKAILFLRGNPNNTNRYSKAILSACVHNTSYDPQVEPDRSQYLYEAIQLSADKDSIERQVISSFKTSKRFYNIMQLSGIVRRIAQNGNALAREALYEKFRAYPVINIGNDLIYLDRGNGLLEATEVIGSMLLLRKDHKDNQERAWQLYYTAKEVIGEEEARNIISDAATTSNNIKAFIDNEAIQDIEVQKLRSRKINRDAISYEELKKEIDNYHEQKLLFKSANHFYRLSMRASKKTICKIANDFLQEQNEEKLIPYLLIFRRIKFPFIPTKLIQIACSDYKYNNIAFQSLKHIRHKLVRSLAIKLINQGNENRDVLSLFINNYEPRDYLFIEKAITEATNKDIIHKMCIDVRSIFKMKQTNECQNLLVKIFYKVNCSICRYGLVEVMLLNNVLPEYLIEECKYDSNLELREMVNKISI